MNEEIEPKDALEPQVKVSQASPASFSVRSLRDDIRGITIEISLNVKVTQDDKD